MTIFDNIRRFLGDRSPNGDADGTPADPEPCPDDGAIPCAEALQLVHDYLDGELDDVPASQVKRHFEVCGRCYPHLRFESAYREAVRRVAAGQAAPPGLKAKVVELLAEARSGD